MITSRRGLSYDFGETGTFPHHYKGSAFKPLLDPTSGALIGFLVNKECEVNFTYNDLFKLYLGARRSGLKVDASDEQGIVDETYEREVAEQGYVFYWLPSFIRREKTGGVPAELGGRREQALLEIKALLARMADGAKAEAAGRPQEGREAVADAHLQGFLMGAQAIAHKYGFSRPELDALLLAAHNQMPQKYSVPRIV